MYVGRVSDHGLLQVVKKYMKQLTFGHIFYKSHLLLERLSFLPGLSNHDIVLVDNRANQERKRPLNRKIHIELNLCKNYYMRPLEQTTKYKET